MSQIPPFQIFRSSKMLFFLLAAILTLISADQAGAKLKNSPESVQRKNIRQFEKIVLSMSKKNFDEALKFLDELDRSDKLNRIERAYVASYRGNICFTNNDLDCSVSEFEKILALKSHLPTRFYTSYYLALAQVYRAKREYHLALEYARQYIQLQAKPSLAETIVVGRIYFDAKDYQQALNLVQPIIEAQSKASRIIKSDWLYLLIDIRKELNSLSSAEDLIDSLDPVNPKTKYRLYIAEAYGELGQAQERNRLQNDLIASGSAGFKGGRLVVWQSDGELLPKFRPSPTFPRKAAMRRQEGWVDLIMDINTLGQTENVRVENSSRRKTFDQSAIKSAQGYLFEPVIKNGEPVRVNNYQIRIKFELGD